MGREKRLAKTSIFDREGIKNTVGEKKRGGAGRTSERGCK